MVSIRAAVIIVAVITQITISPTVKDGAPSVLTGVTAENISNGCYTVKAADLHSFSAISLRKAV